MKHNYLFFSFLALSGLVSSCDKHKVENAVTPVRQSAQSRMPNPKFLAAPVNEAKMYKLLPGYDHTDDFEASSVYNMNGYFYIVCDNMFKIAKIKSTLPINSSQNTLVATGAPGSGSSNFEGITFDNYGTTNFYVVAETEQNGSHYQPRIYEYDQSLNYQSRAWADYNFISANSNKGFEGIQWVRRNGDDYMLGMVEGTGKIPVLKQTSGDWVLVDSIALPSNVTFNDYADICVKGDTIAILSQEDSQFWLGTFSGTSWSISGPGQAYQFPLGDNNGNVGGGTNIIYANVEGLSFINDSTIVVVSDKAKSSQPGYQSTKDQSVHIFTLPH